MKGLNPGHYKDKFVGHAETCSSTVGSRISGSSLIHTFNNNCSSFGEISLFIFVCLLTAGLFHNMTIKSKTEKSRKTLAGPWSRPLGSSSAKSNFANLLVPPSSCIIHDVYTGSSPSLEIHREHMAGGQILASLMLTLYSLE